VKFLVDECLSPALVRMARARGFHESTHVTWLGLASRKDWTIARRAIDDGFVFVTNNRIDFAAFYARQEIHVGLVCLNVAHGRMSLMLQKQLFALALEELVEAEPINEVLEITVGPDGGVSIDRYWLPEPR
jgi:predicted nuclease of predicted toxin-antitoxin system